MGFWRVIPSSQELEKLVPRSHGRATAESFPAAALAASLAARIWLPRSGNVRCCPQNEIYDIGTEILYFQCFVTTDMFLFCKPIIFSGNCRICRDLAFGSVKTRFKAILRKLDFSAQIDFLQLFGEICRQKMPKVSKVNK